MKKLLLITLLIVIGCDKYALTEHTHDEYVEIDWILIKNPQMIKMNNEEVTTEASPDGTGEYQMVSYSGIGYTFISTSSVSNANLFFDEDVTIDNFNGILTFTFNSENYSYDISDSYHSEMEEYLITYSTPENVSKISCYDNMNYCHATNQNGLGYILELTSPFEIIDYR